MSRPLCAAFSLALLIVTLPSIAGASPWLLPEGQGSLQATQLVQRSTKQFAVDGTLEDYSWGGKQLSFDNIITARFGVAPRVEVGAQVAYKYIDYQADPLCVDTSATATSPEDYRCPTRGAEGESYNSMVLLELDVQTAGFSDLWLNTTLQILDGPLRISVAPVAKFPLFYEPPSSISAAGADDVTLGAGQIDVGGFAYFGGVIPNAKTFLRGDIGYLHRFGAPGDQLRWVARVGYLFRPKVIFAFGGQGEHTLTPGESIGTQGIRIEADGTIVVEDVAYEPSAVNLDLTTILRPAERTEVLISVFQVVAGSYVGASAGASLGLIRRF